MLPPTDTIREQLFQVGLSPSRNWLEECISALAPNSHVDSVFLQALYHDLRDVVREWDRPGASQPPSYYPILPPAPTEIRRVVTESMQSHYQYKGSVPATFRLLVQIEEHMDVCLSAQQRLEQGGPTDTNQQRQRCFKFLFSDGYPPMDHHGNPSLELLPFVGMEVSPIHSLPVNANAGIKVLLHGPIEFRHGIAMCHPGNTTVMGGHVDAWVDVQRGALEKAKRAAGVGIDPTIKALIWNNQIEHESEEAQDEAEHESSDVPQPPTNRPIVPPAVTAVQAVTMAPVGRRTVVSPRTTLATTTATIPTMDFGNPGIVRNAPRMSSVMQSADQPSTSIIGSQQHSSDQAFMTATGRMVGTTIATNPYQMAPPGRQRVSQSPVCINPPPSVSRCSPGHSSEARTAVPFPPPPQAVLVDSQSQPDSRLLTSIITCEQLHHQLTQAQQDRSLYEKMYGETYQVQLCQFGLKDHFNIEKRKKRRTGDEAKYEYVLNAKFSGPNMGPPILSGRVDNSILEPHFRLNPCDMRSLQKRDKNLANDYVREGGRSVYAQMQTLATYIVTLDMTPEEFFMECRSLTDGTRPVLLLRQRL